MARDQKARQGALFAGSVAGRIHYRIPGRLTSPMEAASPDDLLPSVVSS